MPDGAATAGERLKYDYGTRRRQVYSFVSAERRQRGEPDAHDPIAGLHVFVHADVQPCFSFGLNSEGEMPALARALFELAETDRLSAGVLRQEDLLTDHAARELLEDRLNAGAQELAAEEQRVEPRGAHDAVAAGLAQQLLGLRLDALDHGVDVGVAGLDRERNGDVLIVGVGVVHLLAENDGLRSGVDARSLQRLVQRRVALDEVHLTPDEVRRKLLQVFVDEHDLRAGVEVVVVGQLVQQTLDLAGAWEVEDHEVLGESELGHSTKLLGLGLDEDRRGQRQHVAEQADPEEHQRHGDDESPASGRREEIAVPDRRYRHDGPPERVGPDEVRVLRQLEVEKPRRAVEQHRDQEREHPEGRRGVAQMASEPDEETNHRDARRPHSRARRSARLATLSFRQRPFLLARAASCSSR